ncbi:MAG: DNA polymerase III, subunit gamma and tau [Candidatus Amoebophilus sp. 36-38]|nr:MAG: DNA polymerase III, subunit gamma and tau [Candidatus Amoebophilus sp. 36-38]
MEKFVVSARKYRPHSFNDVLGQTHVTTTLKNAIKTNHLAHAFLFCGPKGVGKTTSARILAKAINCQQLTADTEPCDVCVSCKSFNEHTSFNIYELDAASNNSVEDIRSLVDQIRYPPQHGSYKIYIIDEVHMLSQAAFNAFLKTLEEPPKYVIFILATTEKHKVLPTILSRCQIFDFQRIKPEVIVQQLKNVANQENIPYDEEALHLISLKSDGALRDALSMFDVIASFGAGKVTYEAALANLHILDYNCYFNLTEAFLQGDINRCLLAYEEIVRSGFDGLYFLEGLIGHFRSLLVSQDPETLVLLEVAPSVQEKYRIQTQQTSPRFLLGALHLANECAVQYKDSLNKRFHVELMLIELATRNSTSLEKKTTPPEKTSPSSPENNAMMPDANQVAISTKAEVLNQEVPIKIKENATKSAQINQIANVSSNAGSSTTKMESLQTTIKIPQLAQIKANIDQIITTDISSLASTNVVNIEITQETVIRHWKDYAQQLKTANKIPAYNLMNQTIELEGHIILIKFTNSIEEHILNEIKEDLISYLRSNLQSALIDIKAIFTASQPTSHKPYTAQEKFRHLVKKNPHLQSLKDQLRLEIIS